jgi:SAM-dependent methyltransferase
MLFDSDKQWIRLGRFDPYLQTVRTLDPYKLDSRLANTEDRYFASGESYVADLFAAIERYVRPGFRPKGAVDFGCSVGRIAIPLARRCEWMIGLDVSADALAEAGRNADRFAVSNSRWLASDDRLSRITEGVDLFHSYNVLQHMPVERGVAVVRRALELLAPGGVLAVHVPYADRAGPLRRLANWGQAHVPAVHALANVVRRRPWNYPHMLMNPYDLATLISLARERGCEGVYCKHVDQGRYPGVILFACAPPIAE